MEVWKDVVGYEGLYQVSDKGRVKSFYNGGRIMKNTKNGQYLKVTLTKDKVEKTYSVHRIVAIAFIPNPNNFPEVNHKDECCTNNMLSNLEWCDRLYNLTYGTCRQRSADKQSIKVEQLLNGVVIDIYKSINSTKEHGFSPQAISEVCRGKRNRHHGYEWRCAND